MVSQLRAEIANLQKIVGHLAGLTCSKGVPHILGAELREDDGAHKQTNNNNDDNNNNDHNTNIQESSLGSLDLDDDNPESSLSGSEPDLDESSLASFDPNGDEASSLDNLGHQTMTVASSLGSLDQQDDTESSSSFDQEGMMLGTTRDPSLDQTRDNFGKTKPKKRVTFSKATLAAYNETTQNKENRCCKTTRACWNNPQQEHQQMQQQPATASKKELEHRPCNNNSLDGEDQSLGSLESQTQTMQACRSPKHNNNTSSLGQGSKNTAAWGILIDTGAAISFAPMSFAPGVELSPLESTLQLRSVTGRASPAFGRRTINMIGSQLSFRVSFVIADVEHALLGMDIFMQEQLSLQRGSNNEHYLVNVAGERTQLQQRGHHLYLEACPREFGLITCMRSSLPQENGNLLDDEDSDQQVAASQEEDLGNCEVSASGGAFGTSFCPENLRQQQDKNTTSLGTTALPKQGARRRRKKPSARTASHDQLAERSFEQKGQSTAATQLRTNLEKTSLIKEIELAAEDGKESLSKEERQELSLRILLTLSLRNKWQIVATRATTACSEDALGQQLRNMGLERNKMDQNIFSGDELVIMIRKSSILIGGTDLQQEGFFCELSASIALEQTTKLDQDTPVSFCNKTLEYNASSNSIDLSLPTTFYMELLQRHDLEDEEPSSSLDEQELSHQDASKQDNTALDAGRQELYRRTVGDLVWATTCRPDLSFEVHLLTQSFTAPTREQERQLQRVLSYIKGTLLFTLSLHPANKRAEEKAQSLDLLAFSASSWTEACRSTSTAYLTLWGVPLIASCRTSCAYKQADAEVGSVRLALGLVSHTKACCNILVLISLKNM